MAPCATWDPDSTVRVGVRVRVLGSVALSGLVPGESATSWLEWVGVGLDGRYSFALRDQDSREWMVRRNEGKVGMGVADDLEDDAGNQEFLPVTNDKREQTAFA